VRKRTVATVASLAGLAIIGLAVYWFLAGLRESVQSFYDAYSTALLLKNHLQENGCRWPSSWADLEPASVEVFGDPTTVDHLQHRVSIAWSIDPCAALAQTGERIKLIAVPNPRAYTEQINDDLYQFLAENCCDGDAGL
jgi:hypothetical protein